MSANAIQQGSVLGGAYEVLRELGAGGSARVYQARQRSTGQLVALKVVQFREGESDRCREELAQQLKSEQKLCAQLSHPNIVRLFDCGELEGGLAYAVFERVQGRTLAEVLAAEGALRPREIFHVAGQLLDALCCAHQLGIVHRDLSPQNIMLTETGARRNALILDFGLGGLAAEIAREGAAPLRALGTPAYASPEQLQGLAPTPGSDLYAWGLIFLECWTGAPVMAGGSLAEVLHRQLSPRPVRIPAALAETELGALLERATRKDPAARSSSAAALLEDLGRCARRGGWDRDEPEPAPAPSLPAGAAARGRFPAVAPRAAGLSALWQVPLHRNPDFTGREALLAQLERALAAQDRCGALALHGLGGVGKSQLALEHAYRCARAYDLVAWLRAETPAALSADFAALAAPLGLPERDAPDQRARAAAVRAHLEQRERWLLIFDNAPDPAALRGYLPRGGSGHALITSRCPDWRGSAGALAVDVLEPQEAVHFLERRLPEREPGLLEELSEELGRLPLALEEAAAYMDASGRGAASYLALLRARQGELLAAGTAPPEYPATVRSTWEISFGALEQGQPEAAELLLLCAFLAPDAIPLALLEGPDGAGDELRVDRSVAALRRYSLVKVERRALSVHRLVQAVARDRLAPAVRAAWAERALRRVEELFPKGGSEGDLLPEAARLLPHAQAALQHAEALPQCADVAARLLVRTAMYLSARGLQTLGAEHLSRAQRFFELARGSDRGRLARVLSHHALVLYAIGQLDGALERLERALAIALELGGPDSPALVPYLVNLAAVHGAQRWDLARAHAERALAILAAGPGDAHLGAMASSILARVLLQLGRSAEALATAERACAALGREDAPEHPLLCYCFIHLAFVFLEAGQYGAARRCTARALSTAERAYADHPLVAASLAARGALHQALGERDDALRCYQRALASGERACLALHQDIALARPGLARILLEQGQPEAARATAEHALARLRQTCGDHARVEARARAALAEIELAAGAPGAALAQAGAAQRTLELRFGRQHPYLVESCVLLGRVQLAAGAWEAAEDALGRALALAEAHCAQAHPALAESLECLALLATEKRQYERAAAHTERALAVREALGADGGGTHALRQRLAQLAVFRGG